MKEVEKLPTSILQRGKKKRVTASQGYPLLCFVKSPLGSSPNPICQLVFNGVKDGIVFINTMV